MTSRLMVLGVITLLMMSAISVTGTQTSTEPSGMFESHVSWLVSVFAGQEAALSPETMSDRFADDYFAEESGERFVATMAQMADTYGPIAFDGHLHAPAQAQHVVARFVSVDGHRINVAMIVDHESRKLVALILGPAMEEIDPRWMAPPTVGGDRVL